MEHWEAKDWRLLVTLALTLVGAAVEAIYGWRFVKSLRA